MNTMIDQPDIIRGRYRIFDRGGCFKKSEIIERAPRVVFSAHNDTMHMPMETTGGGGYSAHHLLNPPLDNYNPNTGSMHNYTQYEATDTFINNGLSLRVTAVRPGLHSVMSHTDTDSVYIIYIIIVIQIFPYWLAIF